MSAASRLWRRAPLWRWSLYLTVFFTVLAALYPTPRLLHRIPQLSRLPGSDTHRRAPVTAPENASSSTAADPNASGDNAAAGPDRVGAPNINTALTGGIPFAGHTLPLPAGVWHPVLTGQVGPGGAILFNILARTDRGIVTGVVIARTTIRPQPGQSIDGIENSCHDDRNFMSRILSEGRGGILECWSVARSTGSSSELINTAFQRLHTLGFPVPSLFVTTSWVRASATKDNSGANLAAVDTLLAPIKPGTVQLLAPLPYWDKSQVAGAPAAQNFVRATDRWMTNWVGVLRGGLLDGLPGGVAPLDLSTDPAAPPSGL
ncbi:hypothetical protein AA101099_2031 [Neoasaia chiangmaiensis NBRC 101099]|uniref:Uncharacterized protein n=1 Tax=Neoasaia chiangmaiensis TaxID=320497 RepID=A0A1U9KT05_9PROT|nr:hypothetical protein [Neoasaia chiangmaiensis]AQS88966.1 hypothetical protein A0U93_14735 [Neoasaia chiangmaiensis]GBR40269.1 hypothetical protein AA101099_2031 [Neoasaia chiangmaiensis NBRC 101099]GEN13983.1 hypothetical protein NCH01_04140 [Neoasaia chiangmaiensis]